MSLLNIGISGLRAQQAALNVVGQNITNASTPGYTRQRAEIESISGSSAVSFGVGSGARVAGITRIADQYIDEQIRTDTSLHSRLESMSANLSQLEGGLFDSDFGVDSALRDLFGALQDAAAAPADLAARDFVLNSAEVLANRFHRLTERTQQQSLNINDALQSATVRVNEIGGLLTGINERIANLQGQSSGGALNAMLDQRQQLLKELAQYVSVSTAEQEDGQLNVFIGKGQPLVLGQQVGQLSVSNNGELLLRPIGGGASQVVTSSLNGGEIGGLRAFREDVLRPVQNEIGRLAAVIGATFNQQHSLGIDLRGELGRAFFADLNPPAAVSARVDYLSRSNQDDFVSTGRVNVYITDPLAGVASDYEIRFSESDQNAFTITRQADGEVVYRGVSLNVPETIELDGLQIEFASGQFQAGEGIALRPYADLGSNFEVAITDPSSLALGAPVLSDSDAANQGNGRLEFVDVVDIDHPLFGDDGNIMPPLLVEFVTDTHYRILDNSNPAQPVRLQPDLGLQQITLGTENHIFPYQLGTSVVESDGPSEAQIQTAPGAVPNLNALGNGYPSSVVDFDFDDATLEPASVSLTAGLSARQIAQQLSAVSGVQASASTYATLSNLNVDTVGTVAAFSVNGEIYSGFQTLAELADAINANPASAAQGITARSDGQTLQLTALFGDDLALHFQGDPTESVVLSNSRGQTSTLQGFGAGQYATATVGGELSVVLDPGVDMSSNSNGLFASDPVQQRADLGFDMLLTGNVRAGDRFEVAFNEDGLGDNRNARALTELGATAVVGDPPRTFAGTFGLLVQEVGVQSSRVQINQEAAATLLQQSESFRESVSGVNLDEEAANLIRHEQAYNAAAQLITVARDTFNTLLNSVS